MNTVISREVIARQAQAAVAHYIQQPPGSAPPPNPYCSDMEPEHHRQWAASFARALHAELAPADCEGGC